MVLRGLILVCCFSARERESHLLNRQVRELAYIDTLGALTLRGRLVTSAAHGPGFTRLDSWLLSQDLLRARVALDKKFELLMFAFRFAARRAAAAARPRRSRTTTSLPTGFVNSQTAITEGLLLSVSTDRWTGSLCVRRPAPQGHAQGPREQRLLPDGPPLSIGLRRPGELLRHVPHAQQRLRLPDQEQLQEALYWSGLARRHPLRPQGAHYAPPLLLGAVKS